MGDRLKHNTTKAAHWPTCIAVLALALLGTGPALAQNNAPDLTKISLEDLMRIEVYSASKESEQVAQAPSSVSVITADEIRKYGYRTLADVLRSLRGFYVTYDRNYSYLGARGFARHGSYDTRILLLVDGHRLNDNIYDEALLGTEFPVDVDLIERIEVVRGPSSSLYGTCAFFGVINIITRKRSSLENAEVSAEMASFGSYKGRVTLGHSFRNGLDMLLSGSFYDSHGQERLFFNTFNSPETNNGYAVNADADQSRDFLANLSFRDFSLQGVYGTREKHIPTAPLRHPVQRWPHPHRRYSGLPRAALRTQFRPRLGGAGTRFLQPLCLRWLLCLP